MWRGRVCAIGAPGVFLIPDMFQVLTEAGGMRKHGLSLALGLWGGCRRTRQPGGKLRSEDWRRPGQGAWSRCRECPGQGEGWLGWVLRDA